MVTRPFGWPREEPDGSVVWSDGSHKLLPVGECDTCDTYREKNGPSGFFPSHDGSRTCRGMPYSIARAGPDGRAHCTCDGCF